MLAHEMIELRSDTSCGTSYFHEKRDEGRGVKVAKNEREGADPANDK